jgi:hypothetical protein
MAEYSNHIMDRHSRTSSERESMVFSGNIGFPVNPMPGVGTPKHENWGPPPSIVRLSSSALS